MDYTRFANWGIFLKEHGDKFSNCKYPFYENKCKEIVRNIFHLKDISKDEEIFLEKQSGISVVEWKRIVEEFNYGVKQHEEELFQEYPMDANCMPFAP